MESVTFGAVGGCKLRMKLRDSTTGEGKKSLTSATVGLIISTICDNEAAPTVYTQAAGTIETITTIGTFQAPTATKCRFKLVDDTNHSGVYEFHFADARMVANARRMTVSVSGPGIKETDKQFILTRVDLQDGAGAGLSRIDVAIGSRMATFTYVVPLDADGTRAAVGLATANLDTQLTGIHAKTTNLPASPAAVGSAMTLSPAEREATAAVVEGHLLDEGDAQLLINAIVGAIGNTNLDQAAVVAAIRADLERSGGNLNTLIGSATEARLARLDVAVSSRMATFVPAGAPLDAAGTRAAVGLATANLDTQLSGIHAKTTNLPASPAAVGSAMTLSPAERDATATVVESHLLDEGDAQLLINAIVGAIGNTNLDQAAVVAAIRADLERGGGNLSTLLTRITDLRMAKLDIAGTLAHTGNADTFKADVTGLLTTAVFNASGVATFATRGLTMIETIGAGVYRFTGPALALAPTGSGGGGGGGFDVRQVTFQFFDEDDNPVPNVAFSIPGIGANVADGTGERTIGFSDGSYTIVAAPTGGVIFPPVPFTVSSDGTVDVVGAGMTPIIPSAPEMSVGTTIIRTLAGAVVPYGVVRVRMTDPPGALDTWQSEEKSIRANVLGVVSHEFPIGGSFEMRRGSGPAVPFLVPDAPTFALPQLLG